MRLVSTTEAAALLDVPADLIAKWKHRGRVVQRDSIPGPGRGGQVPLYRLDELRPLAERYHATRRKDGDE